MENCVYFVVVVDADPNLSRYGEIDRFVLEKYRITLDLIKDMLNGKAAMCVHTSPLYRDRFFRPPFTEFFSRWVRQGGELVLHPEEDVYATPQSRLPNDSYYSHPEHMEAIIRTKIRELRNNNLPLAAFRGALFGFTDEIAAVVKNAGIGIDLSCAPGIVIPERRAQWSGAPASGYHVSSKSYRRPADRPDTDALFEIPLGWDGKGTDLSVNYLFHERSTTRRLCRVWDVIRHRSSVTGHPQFVNFLCHTASMQNRRLRAQLVNTILYMKNSGGMPITAGEAKSLFQTVSPTADL